MEQFCQFCLCHTQLCPQEADFLPTQCTILIDESFCYGFMKHTDSRYLDNSFSIIINDIKTGPSDNHIIQPTFRVMIVPRSHFSPLDFLDVFFWMY
tara:strand:+ start:2183 stop:2470 length:288 start_codon:yes stop_codon:yes gene_type:complete